MHFQAFQRTKDILSSSPVLCHFSPTAETALHTDGSRLKGLGFCLMQRHSIEDPWSIVICGSRFLSDVEARYATTEIELLAVLWAAQKCSLYLLGLPRVSLLVDHQPLLPIINTKSLEQIHNPRLFRLSLIHI